MAESRNPTALISPPPSLVEVDDRSSLDDVESYCDLASITSSVLDYEYENGRRYHAYRAGSYPLPNDEKELDRIDLKHHVFMLLCSGHLHLAPLKNPGKILDLGTGTGIWALEMAEQYPDAKIIGTDLSPVQPQWVPDNVSFEIDDFESKQWTWPDNHFDYVHSRFLVSSVSSYRALIRKAFKTCKPGGYFELQELNPRFYSDDGSLTEDSSLEYWSKIICEAAETYNRPVPHHDDYRAWFEKAGFEDVVQFVFKSPSNPWPKDPNLKEVAKFQLCAHLEGLEGISLALLTRALVWKPEEVQLLMAKIRPEIKNRHIHSYQPHFAVIGRKPFTPGSSAARLSQLSLSGSSSLRSVPSQDYMNTPGTPGTEHTAVHMDPVQNGYSPAALSSNLFTPVIDLPQPETEDNAQNSMGQV